MIINNNNNHSFINILSYKNKNNIKMPKINLAFIVGGAAITPISG